MAVWEGITESAGESLLPNLVLVAAAVALAPIVVPGVLSGMRPLAKTLVKGGIVVYDKAQEMVAEVGEQMSDLMAEVRAEFAEPVATAPPTTRRTRRPSEDA
jgi:hypothetical protein